jgi:hypothetical protein
MYTGNPHGYGLLSNVKYHQIVSWMKFFRKSKPKACYSKSFFGFVGLGRRPNLSVALNTEFMISRAVGTKLSGCFVPTAQRKILRIILLPILGLYEAMFDGIITALARELTGFAFKKSQQVYGFPDIILLRIHQKHH